MTLLNKHGFISLVLSVYLCANNVLAFSQSPDIKTSASSSVEGFSFVVFGDNRDGDNVFMDLLNKIKTDEKIRFAVNTGDFVPGGKKEEYINYLSMIAGFPLKIYQVPGNHDMVGRGYKYFAGYFGPDYYSFDCGNSHFIVLNNALKESFDAGQFAWMRRDLAGTKKENKFVFMHRPCFDPTEIYKNYTMSGRKIVEELMGLFEKFRVDYVFAGHIHGYARTSRNGVVYVVTAGAGAPLYLPVNLGGYYHYVRIKVDGSSIKDEVVKIYE